MLEVCSLQCLWGAAGVAFFPLCCQCGQCAVYCAEKHNRSLSACSLTGCFTGLAADVLTCVCDAVCVCRVALRNFVDGLDGSFSLRMKRH